MVIVKKILILIVLLTKSYNVVAFHFWNDYQAYHYYQKADYVNAARYCENLLLTAPYELKNLINMGNILYKQGKYLQASNYFEQAAHQATNHDNIDINQRLEIWFNLGSAHAQQEKWQAALDAYMEVVKIKSDHERALKNIEIIKKLLEKEKEEKKEKEEQKQNQQSRENQNQEQDQSDKQSHNKQDDDQQAQNKQSAEHQKNDQQQDRQKSDGNSKKQAGEDQSNSQANQADSNQGQDKSQSQAENKAMQTSVNDAHDDQSKSNYQAIQQANQAKIETLNEQEKDYLAAVEQTNQRANRYLMQMQNLQGAKNENGNSW